MFQIRDPFIITVKHQAQVTIATETQLLAKFTKSLFNRTIREIGWLSLLHSSVNGMEENVGEDFAHFLKRFVEWHIHTLKACL